MPAKTGKGSQRKGRAFERAIMTDLWRQSGHGGPPWSAHARPDQGYRPPPEFSHWTLELKNQERLNIWDALIQARSDRGEVEGPFAVIFRRSFSDTYVAIPYEEWVKLVLTSRSSQQR